ncbi:hypothetical protein C2L64_09865 [Paraburkholderia hospita]|jgi:hypothetical protein|uniref:Uncharacterized protein n=1 Tax=Paraburkholderia hospita TaxID=169430 RepID=A0AAN1J7Q2_9BURK|nr:hypothetical protein C2L64_09865 [Paraburkholderia hospita]
MDRRARSALDTTLFRLLHGRRQTISLTPLTGRVTGLTPNGEAHGINSTAPAFYGRYAALAPKQPDCPCCKGGFAQTPGPVTLACVEHTHCASNEIASPKHASVRQRTQAMQHI